MVNEKATRRRGAALEHALLSAAWDELTEAGYAGLTLERVAARARTSTPVLYRRWPDRWALAVAAVRHYGDENPVTLPDTGSLRGDLLAFLTEASAKRSELIALLSVHMAEFFDETHSSPAQLRQAFLGERPALHDEIYDRAARRGEIDPDRLTARVKALPFDLLRNEVLMTLQPAPRGVIEEIVDDVVLPVLAARRATGGKH